MPTERLVWSDDFNYPNTTALEAAYQNTVANGGGTNVFTIDPIVPGPTGYATGCTSQHVATRAFPGSFNTDQPILGSPHGRYFHIRGVHMFNYTENIDAAVPLIRFLDNSTDFDIYFQLNLRKSDNFIELVVNNAAASYPTRAYDSGYVAGVTAGVVNQIDVFGYISTAADSGGGVYVPNSDGSITVQVNGSTVISHTGIVWNFTSAAASPGWNYIEFHPAGTFSGLRIWDEAPPVTIQPVPTAPPTGPQTPCQPASQVSGGGTGNSGCNAGGVGRTKPTFSTYGHALVHADASAPESLVGATAIDVWVTLFHQDYPSGTVTPYSFALTELADLPTVYHGRKPAGLLNIGNVQHGLGADTGGFAASAVDIHISDALTRQIYTLLDGQDLDGDEIEVWVGTEAGRAAGTARVLMRAVVQGPQTQSSLHATLTAVDTLFSIFGPLGVFPNWPFWKIGDAFPDAPNDVKDKALPVLYGYKTDAGAVDPVTNVSSEKGLVPWHYVGQRDLSAANTANAGLPTTIDSGIGAVPEQGILGLGDGGWVSTGDVSTDPYHGVVRVKNGVMGPLSLGRAGTPSPVGTVYGFRNVWNDSSYATAADYYISFQVPASVGDAWQPTDPVPTGANIRYQVVSGIPSNPYDDWQFLVFWQTQDSGNAWDGEAAGGNLWDAYLILGHAAYQGGAVYGSDLGNGDPKAQHSRVQLDLTTRNGSDLLYPWNADGTIASAWSAVFGTQTYTDVTGADGNTYRTLLVYARGPLSDDHKKGVVNLTCNMVGGVEDVGDGTGNPIVAAHDAEQHWIENFLLNQYRSGVWVTSSTAPKWPDGTYKVRSTRFADRQAFTVTALGGIGLEATWYVDTAKALTAWFQEWNDSTETSVGLNGFGQISLGYIDETVDASTWPKVDHVTDIFGTVTTKFGTNRENTGAFSCDWDPDKQTYRIGPVTLTNATAIAKYKGRTKSGQPWQSTILGDEVQMRWVGNRRLARLGTGLIPVDIPGRLGLLAYDVDQPGIQLTTTEGRGASGYVDQPIQVRWRDIQLGGGRIVTLTGWDVRDLLLFPPGSTNTLLTITNSTSGAAVITNNTATAPVMVR